jgi:hypothetical protein
VCMNEPGYLKSVKCLGSGWMTGAHFPSGPGIFVFATTLDLPCGQLSLLSHEYEELLPWG